MGAGPDASLGDRGGAAAPAWLRRRRAARSPARAGRGPERTCWDQDIAACGPLGLWPSPPPRFSPRPGCLSHCGPRTAAALRNRGLRREKKEEIARGDRLPGATARSGPWVFVSGCGVHLAPRQLEVADVMGPPLAPRARAPCRERGGSGRLHVDPARAPLPQHSPPAPRPPSELLPDSGPGGPALGALWGAGVLGCSPSLSGATCPGIGGQRDGQGCAGPAGVGPAQPLEAHLLRSPAWRVAPPQGCHSDPPGTLTGGEGAPISNLPEQSQHTRSGQGPQKESRKTLHLSWDSPQMGPHPLFSLLAHPWAGRGLRQSQAL